MRGSVASESPALPDILSYQLSIDPQLEVFLPELEHACAFLDRAHFVERYPEGGDRILHYGPNPPTDAVAVPAVFSQMVCDWMKMAFICGAMIAISRAQVE